MTTTAESQPQGTSPPRSPSSPYIEDISSFPRIHTGTSATTPPTIKEPTTNAPFASQRDTINPFSSTSNEAKLSSSPPKKDDRRLSSDEWDASKTPPSRFQQRKGSVYATPSSRDGHVDKNYDRDAAYHAKLAEKGWAKRRASKGEETTKQASKVEN